MLKIINNYNELNFSDKSILYEELIFCLEEIIHCRNIENPINLYFERVKYMCKKNKIMLNVDIIETFYKKIKEIEGWYELIDKHINEKYFNQTYVSWLHSMYWGTHKTECKYYKILRKKKLNRSIE